MTSGSDCCVVGGLIEEEAVDFDFEVVVDIVNHADVRVGTDGEWST